VGYYPAVVCTTGANNSTLGAYTLDAANSDYNIAIGSYATGNATTGHSNTVVGYAAGDAITTAAYNCYIGRDAGTSSTTGDANTFVGGYLTGGGVTTGSNNTFIGYAAGYNNVTVSTGSSNVLVGGNAHPTNATTSNSVVLGADCLGVGGDGYVTIGVDGSGGSETTDRIYNQFTANATWTHSSDERFKKEIETNEDCGLDFINDLRTVTYKWKAGSELDPSLPSYNPDRTEPRYKDRLYGMIAQEVKTALDKHNIKDFTGWHESTEGNQGISESMFVFPLINAVQELSAKVDDLTEKLDKCNCE